MGNIGRFLGLFSFAMFLCIVMAFPSFAVDIDFESESPEDISVVSTDKNIVIKVDHGADPEEYELQSIETSVKSITSEDTNGFVSVILGLIGNYNMITTDYIYQSYSGSTQHSISTDYDIPWIASALVFLVVLFCVFRFLGGIFSGRK